jgi:hypothetical protein
MENKKTSLKSLTEIAEAYMDYRARFEAFKKEHHEYLEPMLREAEEAVADAKPIDPQTIFDADAFIKDIEAAGMEDDIEGFDLFRYKGYIYHQYKAFVAENRYYDRLLWEIQIEIGQAKLEEKEKMLIDAQEALSKDRPAPLLPRIIELLEENIVEMKKHIGLLTLELAAKQPHRSN